MLGIPLILAGLLLAVWLGYRYMFWGVVPVPYRFIGWGLLLVGWMIWQPGWRLTPGRPSSVLIMLSGVGLSLLGFMAIVSILGSLRHQFLDAQILRRRPAS